MHFCNLVNRYSHADTQVCIIIVRRPRNWRSRMLVMYNHSTAAEKLKVQDAGHVKSKYGGPEIEGPWWFSLSRHVRVSNWDERRLIWYMHTELTFALYRFGFSNNPPPWQPQHTLTMTNSIVTHFYAVLGASLRRLPWSASADPTKTCCLMIKFSSQTKPSIDRCFVARLWGHAPVETSFSVTLIELMSPSPALKRRLKRL
jgi:hypothetical protein